MRESMDSAYFCIDACWTITIFTEWHVTLRDVYILILSQILGHQPGYIITHMLFLCMQRYTPHIQTNPIPILVQHDELIDDHQNILWHHYKETCEVISIAHRVLHNPLLALFISRFSIIHHLGSLSCHLLRIHLLLRTASSLLTMSISSWRWWWTSWSSSLLPWGSWENEIDAEGVTLWQILYVCCLISMNSIHLWKLLCLSNGNIICILMVINSMFRNIAQLLSIPTW